MIGLIDRRDYWVHINKKPLALEKRKGKLEIDCDSKESVTKDDLLALPENDVDKFLKDRVKIKKTKGLYSEWSPELAYQLARLVLGETIEKLRAENGDQPIPLEDWVNSLNQDTTTADS